MEATFARLRIWTPAQIAALAFGIWWIGNGIAVFMSEPTGATLATNSAVNVFGLSIAVNGWHGLFHLLTGLAGVAAAPWPHGSRIYVLLMAALYLAAAFCALFTGATVFGVIHVDGLGSADHAVEGVLMLAAWLATPGTSLRSRGRSVDSGSAGPLP